MNNPEVKQQIHADPSIQWKMCNPDIPSKWQANPQGAIDIYKKILREQHDIRIVIFYFILVDCLRSCQCNGTCSRN